MITRAGAADAIGNFFFFFYIFPLITDVAVGAALTTVLGSSGAMNKKNLIPTPGGFVTWTHKAGPLSPVFAKYVHIRLGARGLQLRLIRQGVASPNFKTTTNYYCCCCY